MFEHVLCLTVQFVELGLTCREGGLLVFDVLTEAVELVACALVLALLLVELKFALLLLCLGRLYFGKARIGGFFGFGAYLESFLASFKRFVAFDVFGLAVSILDDELGSCAGHFTLSNQSGYYRYCGCHDCYCDEIQKVHFYCWVLVIKTKRRPNHTVGRKSDGRQARLTTLGLRVDRRSRPVRHENVRFSGSHAMVRWPPCCQSVPSRRASRRSSKSASMRAWEFIILV